MHEMSIAVELLFQLEELAARNNLVRIEKVEVVAGVLRGIVPDALQIAFEAVSTDTCAAGAELVLKIEAAKARCRQCGHGFEPGQDSYLCPSCERADVEVLAGDDIILSSLSGQQADEKTAAEGKDAT